MRQPAGHHRIGEPLARRHPQPLVVEEGALAALGGEQLVVGRIVDHAGDDRALALERDRDREVRDAVQEVGGAVERIDDPGMGLVGALAAAAFLAEEAVARARLGQLLAQGLLGAPVGGGDEIGRALERHLQVLDLAEVALERAPGLARGLDHDVEEGGAEHGAGRVMPRAVGLPARAAPSRARLLDRLDPGLRRLLAGGADVGLLLLHELVEARGRVAAAASAPGAI